MIKRSANSRKVQWLLKHPDVWKGFPKESNTPGHKSHEKIVFEAMQKARLFSRKTICADVNIQKLVNTARLIRWMDKEQPNPENN